MAAVELHGASVYGALLIQQANSADALTYLGALGIGALIPASQVTAGTFHGGTYTFGDVLQVGASPPAVTGAVRVDGRVYALSTDSTSHQFSAGGSSHTPLAPALLATGASGHSFTARGTTRASIYLQSTSHPATEQIWGFWTESVSGNRWLHLSTFTDTGGIGANAISIRRSGTAIAEINFEANALTNVNRFALGGTNPYFGLNASGTNTAAGDFNFRINRSTGTASGARWLWSITEPVASGSGLQTWFTGMQLYRVSANKGELEVIGNVRAENIVATVGMSVPSLTVSGNLVVNGNTTLGDNAADTLTIHPSAITWVNNPTHSGTHTFTNTITGSITGNAGTVTNGVYTTGSYSNPAWIADLAWSKITGTPTTIGGYGITDFNSLGDARWVQLANFVTLGNAEWVQLDGSYADPAWITSLAWSKLTGVPTTLGDVFGPGSATDNAVALFDGTTGKLIKNSVVLINAGAVSGITDLSASGTISAGTAFASGLGTAAAPSITFSGDLDTGIFRPVTANTLGFAIAGAEAARFSSAGLLIGGTSTTSIPTSLNKAIYLQSQVDGEVLGYSLYVNEGVNNRRVSFFLDDTNGTFGMQSSASTGTATFQLRVGGVDILTANTVQATVGGNLAVTGVITASTANQRFGSATGLTGVKADYNILLYDFAANNWAGLTSLSNGNVEINVGTATRRIWVFDTSGVTTLPGALVAAGAVSGVTTLQTSGNVGFGVAPTTARVEVRGSTADTTANAVVVRNSAATSLFSIRNDGRVDFAGPLNGITSLAMSAALTGATNGTFSATVTARDFFSNVTALGTTGFAWQDTGINRMIARLNSGVNWVLNARDGTGASIGDVLLIPLTAAATIVWDTARNHTIGTINSQTISSAANFTGSLTMAGVLVQNGTDASLVNTGSAGTLNVGAGTGSGEQRIRIRGSASNFRSIYYTTGLSSARWAHGASDAAESGGDAGSNWFLRAYTDAGALIDSVMVVTRVAGGAIAFATARNLTSGPISATGNITTSADFIGPGAGFGITNGSIRWAAISSGATPTVTINAAATFAVAGVSTYAGTATFSSTITQNSTTASLAQSASFAALNVGTGLGSSRSDINIRGAAGQIRGLTLMTGTIERWNIRAGTTAESGSDTGSPFELVARTDAGAFIDMPITITRAAGGSMFLSRPVSMASTLSITGTTTLYGNVRVTSAAAAGEAGFVLQDNGNNRWQLAKSSADGFFLYNYGTATTAFQISYTTNALTHNGAVVSLAQSSTTSELYVGSGLGSGRSDIYVRSAAGVIATLIFNTGTNPRWIVHKDSTAESGSNAGSDFRINAYSDAGAFIDTPLLLARAANGSMTLARPLVVSPSTATQNVAIFGGSPRAADTYVRARASAGYSRGFVIDSATSTRWFLYADSTAESGSDVGSNLVLRAYNDAAGGIDNPLTIVRAGGGAILLGGNGRPLTHTGAQASLAQSSTTALVYVGSGTGSGTSALQVRGAAGQSRDVSLMTGSVERWVIRASGLAETGSDAGSAFQLIARTDAGSLIDVPITITRAAGGAMTLARPLTFSNYAGVGTRALVVDASGVVSATAAGTGDVVGPASAVDSNLAAFDTTTGKLLKDSLIPLANVIVSTGSYADPAWVTSLAWSKVASTPTTIAGYGITDFVSLGNAEWVQLDGSYANPAWITALAWSKITSTPTTISGYGITDGVVGPASATDNAIVRFDGTTGKLVQNSAVTIADTGVTTITSTTSNQLSVRYDASNRLDVTITSGGNAQIVPTGSNVLKTAIVTPNPTLYTPASNTVLTVSGVLSGNAATQFVGVFEGGSLTATANNTALAGIRVNRGGVISNGGFTGVSYSAIRITDLDASAPSVLHGLFIGSVTGASSNYAIYTNTGQVRLGDVMGVAGATPSTSTALITPQSSTSRSSLRIPHGTAPSAPVNGDYWTDTGSAKIYVSGVTHYASWERQAAVADATDAASVITQLNLLLARVRTINIIAT